MTIPLGNTGPDPTPCLPRLQQLRRGRRLAKKPEEPVSSLTAEQRLLVLDAWQRSGLPARDFAPLVGMLRLEEEGRHRRPGWPDGRAPRWTGVIENIV